MKMIVFVEMVYRSSCSDFTANSSIFVRLSFFADLVLVSVRRTQDNVIYFTEQIDLPLSLSVSLAYTRSCHNFICATCTIKMFRPKHPSMLKCVAVGGTHKHWWNIECSAINFDEFCLKRISRREWAKKGEALSLWLIKNGVRERVPISVCVVLHHWRNDVVCYSIDAIFPFSLIRFLASH